MATQNLTFQSIAFLSSTNSIDASSILANSLVQSLAQNSAGNDLVTAIKFFQHWNGTIFTESEYFEISCFVTAAFSATIQQNIPNLQADFPQYRVVTWGHTVTFGN